jgi:hypothetical protein
MKTVDRPWETWKLDKQFLKSLFKHNTERPDETLDRVLTNICDSLGVENNLLEFIPKHPFPAEDLVKGLGSLVRLAVVRSTTYS